MTSIDQLDQFLSKNPDIEIFEVLLHDLMVLKGASGFQGIKFISYLKVALKCL